MTPKNDLVSYEDGPPKAQFTFKEGKNLTVGVNQGLPEDESTIEVKIVRFI